MRRGSLFDRPLVRAERQAPVTEDTPQKIVDDVWNEASVWAPGKQTEKERAAIRIAALIDAAR